MILEDNTVVEVVLPSSVLRDLTDEEMYEYVVRTRTAARPRVPPPRSTGPDGPRRPVVYQVVP
jgi:hypothetical protein